MKIVIAKSANQNKLYEIKITGENTMNIKTAEQKIIEITKQQTKDTTEPRETMIKMKNTTTETTEKTSAYHRT